MTDSRAGAMTGMDDGGIGELEELVLERSDEFVVGTAPQVGSADTAGEERVAGEELRLAKTEIAAVIRKIERDAARTVARRVNDASEKVAPLKNVAFLKKLVNFDEIGSAHPEEGSLHFHAAIEGEIVRVHHDGRAGVLIELGEATDMIDVRVRADDGFDLEFVAAKKAENALDFIARVDDDGFESARITDNRAVALEDTDGQLEIDHLRVSRIG